MDGCDVSREVNEVQSRQNMFSVSGQLKIDAYEHLDDAT